MRDGHWKIGYGLAALSWSWFQVRCQARATITQDGQADVQHDQIGVLGVRLFQPGTPVAGVRDVVSGAAEQQPQGERDVRVILDHKKAAHAAASLACAPGPCFAAVQSLMP